MKPELSIIIKTFERPKSLKKLLGSISDLRLNYPILVADDSRDNSGAGILKAFPTLDIKYIPVAFDSGLSEGRNVLLKHLSTEYFLLCDDDFVFDHRARIGDALLCLKENNIDILGGDFYNYVTVSNFKRLVKLMLAEQKKFLRYLFNRFETSRYIGFFEINDTSCRLSISHQMPPVSPYKCDIVNNFFIARTASIQAMGGWDPVLKLGEHEDFFLRAKHRQLHVAYLADFGTGHYPIIKSNYKKFRERAKEYKTMFARKHNFKSYQEVLKDTGTMLFEIK